MQQLRSPMLARPVIAEQPSAGPTTIGPSFDELDRNHDGVIDREEWMAQSHLSDSMSSHAQDTSGMGSRGALVLEGAADELYQLYKLEGEDHVDVYGFLALYQLLDPTISTAEARTTFENEANQDAALPRDRFVEWILRHHSDFLANWRQAVY